MTPNFQTCSTIYRLSNSSTSYGCVYGTPSIWEVLYQLSWLGHPCSTHLALPHMLLPDHCFPGSFLTCYVFSLSPPHITGPGGGLGILFTTLCPFQIILPHSPLKTSNLESLVIRLQPFSSFPDCGYVPSPPCCFLKILVACVLHLLQHSSCDNAWASQHPQTQYIHHCLPAYTAC